jgi:hypothetical protein
LNVALWHLEMATRFDPTRSQAIELKEEVSGKRVTESDGGIIRSFVSDAVLGGTGAAPLSASLDQNK